VREVETLPLERQDLPSAHPCCKGQHEERLGGYGLWPQLTIVGIAPSKVVVSHITQYGMIQDAYILR